MVRRTMLKCIDTDCDALRVSGDVVCEDHLCTECAGEPEHEYERTFHVRLINFRGTYCRVHRGVYTYIMDRHAYGNGHYNNKSYRCLSKYRFCRNIDCSEIVYDCEYCYQCTLCEYCREPVVDIELRVCKDHIQLVDCVYPICSEKIPITKPPLNGTTEPRIRQPLCSKHDGLVSYCEGCGMIFMDRPCSYCVLKYCHHSYTLKSVILALSRIHRQILLGRCRAIAVMYGKGIGEIALGIALESRATTSRRIMGALSAACDSKVDLAPIKKWMDKITVERLISGLEGHQLAVTTHRLSFPEPAGMDEVGRFAHMLTAVTEGVPYFRDEVYGVPYQRENYYLLIYYLLWWKLPMDVFDKIMSYV